jgi:hypothetical protein
MAKGGTAGNIARYRWNVDVTETVLFVSDVPFFFEDAKLSADRGIAGLTGDLCEDLADGSAFEPIENVHNLALTAR